MQSASHKWFNTVASLSQTAASSPTPTNGSKASLCFHKSAAHFFAAGAL
ncbi:hypothetical protein HMPREF9069_01005 [Atopobium sp. oral taxon 810 str. F0209]|nr:hypothetical protein HMPREF9069_01005 [Atopobium sp. oral taxon 810 str. F0209]